jgi:glycosyltransferase involved in cell wall biosynthesis
MRGKRMQTKTIACCAPFGGGGLGRHLLEVVEDARARHELAHYFTHAAPRDDVAARVVRLPSLGFLFLYTPLRFSPSWKNFVQGDLFDRAVAGRLPAGDTFVGFNGQALRSYRRARQLGYRRLELVSANSHVDNVARQHQRSLTQFAGIETSWLNAAQRRKTLREYELADRIYVASDYTWQSFVAAGVPARKLARFAFRPDPRYQPRSSRTGDGVYRVVYVGSLTVMKGIPVLIEAFSRLAGPAELWLIGGSGTRGMHRYLADWQRRDPRVRVAPGDPLPHLQRASVCVHPSYEDGFAYAPMEAIACGVPAVVTEDTGMKEHITARVNGYVVPTGDWSALLERLEHIRKDVCG